MLWFSLTAANGLLKENLRITLMKVEPWGQDLGQKGVVITRTSSMGQLQVLQGMNVIHKPCWGVDVDAAEIEITDLIEGRPTLV